MSVNENSDYLYVSDLTLSMVTVWAHAYTWLKSLKCRDVSNLAIIEVNMS